MVSSYNLKVYMACTSVLYTKFLVVSATQSNLTFRSGGRPPEDNRFYPAKGRPVQNFGVTSVGSDERLLKARLVEQRWRRIVANDLESLPFALLIFVGGVLADANEAVFASSMLMYTIARVAHSIVFSQQLQPHRVITWSIALVAQYVGLGCALAAAFS